MTLIRLVTFDALFTIITPRVPIHVQYARQFEPYVGVLDPKAIESSFRVGMPSLIQILGFRTRACLEILEVTCYAHDDGYRFIELGSGQACKPLIRYNMLPDPSASECTESDDSDVDE